MTPPSVTFGPRLVGSPTGTLRSALLARPAAGIERAVPLNGEPSAIYARALEQHAVLERTLRYFGIEVRVMDALGDDPRCSAIGDAAVLFESGAMLMRPTTMSRRAEPERLTDLFASIDVPLAGRITPPGLLDGTDVLLAGTTAFVGVGHRGNAIGRAGFANVARAQGYHVVEVPLAPGVPSLRSVAGALASDLIAVAAGRVDPGAFASFETVPIDLGEGSAAGVVCLGERHAIADVRYRTALQRMRRAGVTVEGIDLYEFEKIGITPSMLVLPLRRD